MTKPVDVHVHSVTTEAVLLNVHDMITHDLIGEAMTYDEVFVRKDWRAVFVVWPARVAPVDYFRNQRALVEQLRDSRKELVDLRDEQSTTTDSERYAVLNDPHGPIRDLEHRLQVQKMMVSCMFFATLGMWPNDFRNLV